MLYKSKYPEVQYIQTSSVTFDLLLLGRTEHLRCDNCNVAKLTQFDSTS